MYIIPHLGLSFFPDINDFHYFKSLFFIITGKRISCVDKNLRWFLQNVWHNTVAKLLKYWHRFFIVQILLNFIMTRISLDLFVGCFSVWPSATSERPILFTDDPSMWQCYWVTYRTRSVNWHNSYVYVAKKSMIFFHIETYGIK